MIVSLVGLKGGVGKSMLCIQLGCEAVRRGYKATIVDTDLPQRTSSTWGALRAERTPEGPAVVECRAGDLLPTLSTLSDDVVLVDCSPRADESTRVAVRASDVVLIPVSAEPSEFWSLGGTVSLLGGASNAMVVINRHRPRLSLASDFRGTLSEAGVRVADTSIGMLADYSKSLASGGGVAFGKKCAAKIQVEALFDEMVRFYMGLKKS
jgi:chromosome partitioning protein